LPAANTVINGEKIKKASAVIIYALRAGTIAGNEEVFF
jgi:hypothetical protein